MCDNATQTSIDIRRSVVEDQFDVRRWRSSTKADIECPGSGHHTNTGTDAVVDIDGAPTVYCHHKSCRAEVEEANDHLRETIREEERAAGIEFKFTAEQKAAWRAEKAEAEEKKRQSLRLEAWAKIKLLPKIIAAYRQPLVAWASEAPVPLVGTRPWNHSWLFQDALLPFEHERWWMAPNKVDHGAGKPWAKRYFHSPLERSDSPFVNCRHVAPAYFIACAHLRSPAAVIRRKLMIIELDAYSPDHEQNKEAGCAVARWIAQDNPKWGMRLFAIIDSGNKSAHCWFTWPDLDPEDYEKFKAIMTGLGADPAFDSLSHSFRWPGAMRLNGATAPADARGTLLSEDGRPDEFNLFSDWKTCAWQKLIYLDPSAVEGYDHLPSSEQTHGKTTNTGEVESKQKAGYRDNDFDGYEQRNVSEAHAALIEREGLND